MAILEIIYAIDMQHCYIDKFKGRYVSENDDPLKPKGQFTKPTEQDFVNID